MRSQMVGFTNYENQSLQEMLRDYSSIYEESSQIKEMRSEIEGLNAQVDIVDIFVDIVLFSSKVVEFYNKTYQRIKDEEIDIYTVQELKKMGQDAMNMNKLVGKVVNAYDYDVQKPIKKYYAKLRDYIASMTDLSALGWALERRYFKDGKRMYGKYVHKNIFQKFYGELKEWKDVIANLITKIPTS